MAQGYIVYIWQFYIFFGIILLLLGVITWLIIRSVKKNYSDMAIILTKQGRWHKFYSNFMGSKYYTWRKGKYMLSPQVGIPNKRGKLLFIHAENKPEPLKITYKTQEWLDSGSMESIINNDTIQKILTPKNAMFDMLLMIGAIGGIIAGMASLIVLASTLGFI